MSHIWKVMRDHGDCIDVRYDLYCERCGIRAASHESDRPNEILLVSPDNDCDYRIVQKILRE